MDDIEVPDGGDEGGPVSPGADELPPEGETAAPEGDAPAGDSEGEQQEEGESSPAKGGGGAFEKLLAKYGGDKDKMAAAYFEQANSNSRLWEKIQTIDEYIKGQQRPPAVDEEKLIAEDPNVKSLATDYNDTYAEIQTVARQQDQQIKLYGVLEKDVAKLQGKLEASQDPDVRNELRAELSEKIGEQKSVRADIANSQREVRQLNLRLKDLRSRYADAEARAKEQVSRQRQAELEQRQAAQETRREFADAMRKEADAYGIPIGSKHYEVLFQTINDRIYTYLSRLPNGAPGIDMESAVKQLMAEYDNTYDLKARFKKSSDAKRDATGAAHPALVNPKASEKTPSPPKSGHWTGSFARDRAKRLLGG